MRTLCSCSPRVMGSVAMYVQLPIHLYRLNAASLSGITYRTLGQKQGKMATKRSSQNFTSSPTASLFGFGRSKGKKLPELVQAGDPVLHEPAAEVPLVDIGSERVQNVINDMIAVMRNAPGVGLAAPQIGVPLKIIVLEDKQEYLDLAPTEEIRLQERLPFDLLVIINPKLKRKGRRSARFFEGCLSVNGYRGLVERDLDVEVSGIGQDGLPIKVEASGWQARILQHECDHLDGLIYVDKIIQRSFRIVENLRRFSKTQCKVTAYVCYLMENRIKLKGMSHHWMPSFNFAGL